MHGCWRHDDSVEQTERGETSGTDDVELVRETPVSDCSREKQRNALLKQQKKKEEQQAGVSEQQERWEEGGTYEDDYEEEMVYCEEGRRDLELMTAAVAAMIGMMIPERYEWMLWLACCAVTLWFPLQKRFSWPPCWRTQLSSKPALSPPPSRQPSQAVSIGDGNEDDEPPPPYVELDHVDVYSTRQVQAEAEEPLPFQSANGNGRVPLVRDASRKILTEASCNGGPDWRDDSVAEGEEGGVSQRYRQMVTGLSETEREFVGSAGEEEKNRLLHQVCARRLGLAGHYLLRLAASMRQPGCSQLEATYEALDTLSKTTASLLCAQSLKSPPPLSFPPFIPPITWN